MGSRRKNSVLGKSIRYSKYTGITVDFRNVWQVQSVINLDQSVEHNADETNEGNQKIEDFSHILNEIHNQPLL